MLWAYDQRIVRHTSYAVINLVPVGGSVTNLCLLLCHVLTYVAPCPLVRGEKTGPIRKYYP